MVDNTDSEKLQVSQLNQVFKETSLALDELISKIRTTRSELPLEQEKRTSLRALSEPEQEKEATRSKELPSMEHVLSKAYKGLGKLGNTALDSLMPKIREVGRKWGDTAKQMDDLTKTVSQSMENAFSTLFVDAAEGKLKKFGDYFKSVLSSIQKAIVKMLAQQAASALIKGIIGLFGGAVGGGAAGEPAGGGRSMGVDAGAATRSMAMYHSGGYIPRFHIGGLASDERFAINKVGERYITQEQNEWLTGVARNMNSGQNMNVVVNVENKSSQPVKAKRGDMKFNGKEFVTNIILEDFTSNGPIVQAMKGV